MAGKLTPPVHADDHIQGEDTATIELVEYGDYQCPYCGAAYPVVKRILETFPTQVRFIFRNFPLMQLHPFAMAAAVASEAAAVQDKFWDMHDIIFQNQRKLGVEGLFAMAHSIGLDIERFREDMENESLQEKVSSDFESGMRSGVNGTPSFFVNGIKFDGGAEDLYDMLVRNSS